MDVALGLGAGQIGVGAVGVDDAAVAVGEEHALRHGVDERAADAIVRAAAGKADETDGAGEQRRHADDGENAEKAENEGLRPARLDEGEADRHADEPEGEDDQAPDAADPLRPVDRRFDSGRRVGAFDHVWPLLPLAVMGIGAPRGGESLCGIDSATMVGIAARFQRFAASADSRLARQRPASRLGQKSCIPDRFP